MHTHTAKCKSNLHFTAFISFVLAIAGIITLPLVMAQEHQDNHQEHQHKAQEHQHKAQEHQHEAQEHQVHSHMKALGAPARLQGASMTVSDAVKPENWTKLIRVEAKVSEVCQMKGCWMILTDDANSFRVTFKDYGFFVPKDLAGKTVIVEGRVSEKTLSEDQARHYAEDSGKSQEEVEKIVGDQKTVAMVAETVLIPE